MYVSPQYGADHDPLQHKFTIFIRSALRSIFA